LEREVHEFFGIFFYLNKDLRHLLLDYGFKGFPLLKDFPLSGFVDVIYNDNIKKINYRNLEQIQAYRENCLKKFLI
jgi:NADH-quinone oxidoreductase subunit C